MTLLNDRQICDYAERGMITPFNASLVKEGMSRGLSSFGYDLTLGSSFLWYHQPITPLDPHNVTAADIKRSAYGVQEVVIYPGEFLLAVTVERLALPRNVTMLIKDKSTYARCGIAVQNTVGEAGWSGHLTLEITNHNCRPVILRAGEGICQALFLTGHNCDVSYADRKGKYQAQGSSPVLPRSL